MNTATQTDFDTELRRHNEILRRACDIQFHDHILDIGCGTGQTTRQAARTARAGSALGVDVSAPSIERARQLTRAAKIRNVTFEHADAQTYRFPQDHFDLAISRFGTMFFDDPAARVKFNSSATATKYRINRRSVFTLRKCRWQRNECFTSLDRGPYSPAMATTRALPLFAVVTFLLGIPYLLIAVALTGFDASFVAWARVTLRPMRWLR